jgi:hypothetical protein
VTFAQEVGSRACVLETAPGEAAPSAGATWTAFDTNDAAGEAFTVLDALARAEPAGATRELQVRDARGAVRWIRNAPAKSTADLDRLWSCAADADVIARSLKPVVAGKVRIAPSAPTCTSLTPVVGEASDVTFEPYTVAGRRLVVAGGGVVPVLLLVAGDGAALALPQTDVDACFAVTNRAPSAAEDRTKVIRWLTDGARSDPPPTPLASYLRVAGLDERSCLSEGDGPTRHDECRQPAFGASAGAGDGKLHLFRDRVTEAVHAYGGKLAPAPELAGVNVLVRDATSKEPSFGAAFAKSLAATIADADASRARATSGYRLIRSADAAQSITANAILDVDVSFSMPKLETLTQDRRQRQSRGKASTSNPAYANGVKRVNAARAAIATAERDAPLFRAIFKPARARCDAPSAISCDASPAPDIGDARVASRRAEVASLESALAALPKLIETDDVAVVDYRAKVFRRHGEAVVTLKLSPTDALPNIPPFKITHKVPFESSDMEVAADPAKGIAAHAGRAPEQAQVNAAVAQAVVADASAVVDTWMHRATAGVDANVFERGSRAHLALVARHAASNRGVRLVSDLIEDRPAMLARGTVEYPIRIATPPGGCHALVAVPLLPGSNVNLALRERATRTLVARDARPAPDAAIDVCPLAAGDYVLEVSFRDGRAAPTAIGLFESTPGVRASADYGSVMPARIPSP